MQYASGSSCTTNTCDNNVCNAHQQWYNKQAAPHWYSKEEGGSFPSTPLVAVYAPASGSAQGVVVVSYTSFSELRMTGFNVSSTPAAFAQWVLARTVQFSGQGTAVCRSRSSMCKA